MDDTMAASSTTAGPPASVLRDVPLAQRTTLGVGGPARWLWPVATPTDVCAALAFAASQHVPWWLIGGGSNVIVADTGLAGVVLQPCTPSHDAITVVSETAATVTIRAAAGLVWDELVAWTVAAGLQGVECLSGIPGQVGAAPIQNIGAYGQEVGDVLEEVDGVDVASRRVARWSHADCALGYRDSRFKRQPQEAVVLGVTLTLQRDHLPCLRYAQLATALAGWQPTGGTAGLQRVRDAVLALRRSKGMVVDSEDPDSRSCGSYFVNPVVDPAMARQVAARLADGGEMPAWPLATGEVKLSAAWLIERSGWRRGDTQSGGRVGLSTKHALAIVNRGGAHASEVLAFADAVAARVYQASGVALQREPIVLGT